MLWLWHMAYDFFAALGFILFIFGLVVAVFFDGSFGPISTFWFFFPAGLYSGMMGAFYHWPKELRKARENDDE